MEKLKNIIIIISCDFQILKSYNAITSCVKSLMHFHKSSEAKCVLKSFQLILHITREIKLSILFTRGKNWRLLDPENSSQNLRGGQQSCSIFFPCGILAFKLSCCCWVVDWRALCCGCCCSCNFCAAVLEKFTLS